VWWACRGWLLGRQVELLSRAHHSNLVELLGFCQDLEHQILVYDFMPNGTVRDHLYGECPTPPPRACCKSGWYALPALSQVACCT